MYICIHNTHILNPSLPSYAKHLLQQISSPSASVIAYPPMNGKNILPNYHIVIKYSVTYPNLGMFIDRQTCLLRILSMFSRINTQLPACVLHQTCTAPQPRGREKDHTQMPLLTFHPSIFKMNNRIDEIA